LNINFNFKKKILFLLFLLPNLLLSDLLIDQIIEANNELLIPLELKVQNFVKGNYETSSKIKKIELLDDKKNFLKRLDDPIKLNNSFYFLTNDIKNFYIKVYANESVKCKIDIENIQAINYEKDENEIISQTIKNQKIKLQTNQDTTQFWKEIEKIGTPLIEKIDNDEYILTFLYKGAKESVKLLGGPSSEHVFLDRLENSDIWYKSYRVKKGVKFSYQLAPDVPNIKGNNREKRVAILSTAQMDPFNKMPYQYSLDLNLDKYSKLSTIEIKDENSFDWSQNLNAKEGKIIDTKIKSHILANERNLSIYLPNNFNNKKEFQVLFVFDGLDYQLKVPTPRILDNLIENKKIIPTIAVFIDNPSKEARATELPANKDFAYFMAYELLPFIKKELDIEFLAKNTILTGSSYGGLASMYVAFTYPEFFANVLSQSGSFWWSPKDDEEPEWLTRQIANTKKKEINIYLNAGIYETGYSSIDILESNRHLRTILKAKGYENVIFEEYLSSHDYFAWKSYLANGLIKLQEMKD